MAQSQPNPRVSPSQYLARERRAHIKHEYQDGLVTAMAGATKEHVSINVNLTIELGTQLKGSPCQVFSSDMRARVPGSNSYRYPDLAVACDPLFEDDVFDTLTNPVVLVEIASPATQALDRSTKWNQYRTLPTLRDYVLIAPTRVEVEHRHRAPDGENWFVRVLESLQDELVLDSVNCRVALADIYANIRLESENADAEAV